MIPVASARMYSWSPTLTAAWRRMLQWVADRAGGGLKVLELADPYPLEELWARDDLGCVFMCGYPWAMRAERPHLLAAPVPSPARYNAARFPLLGYRRPDRPTFYSQVVGPLHRQLPVIDAVLDGRADVGPVDAYGLDLLRHHGAERAKRVRVVATTVEAPSAPLVASPGVDAATRKRLTEALLAAHAAPELKPTLEELLIARFVPADGAAFDVMLDRQRQAEAAGYTRLA